MVLALYTVCQYCKNCLNDFELGVFYCKEGHQVYVQEEGKQKGCSDWKTEGKSELTGYFLGKTIKRKYDNSGASLKKIDEIIYNDEHGVVYHSIGNGTFTGDYLNKNYIVVEDDSNGSN